jgi:hypothetical protein
MKMTSIGRRPQNIKSGMSQKPLIGSYSNFKLKLRWPNYIFKILKMKATSNGRRPQNIKSRISQKPIIGLYSNFKLKLIWPYQMLYILKMKMTSNGRQPPMKDDLQYKTTSNGRGPPMEDNHQWKMTSNGRRPQNIKIVISQQPMYGLWVLRGKTQRKSCVRLCLAQLVMLSVFSIIIAYR